MSWMSSISVRAKLALLFVAAAAGVLLVTASGLYGLRSSAQQTRSLVAQDFTVLRQLGELRAAIGNMRRYEKDMFLNLGEAADLARYHQSWRKEVGQGLSLADALASHASGADLQTMDRMKAGLGAYQRGLEAIVADIRQGRLHDPWGANQAMEAYKGDVRAADQAFGAIVERVDKQVAARQGELDALERRTLARTALAGGAVLVLVALMAWLIERRIVLPLREAGAAVRRIAAGDLSHHVPTQGSDEIAQLAGDIARMQADLAQLVRMLRGGIDSVSTASTQIAQGSNDLSARTESQAASLEETAASMEELTGAVAHGASNARHAETLARGAADVASRGGSVVGEVMQTMAGIQQASRRIGEIITVIDGIAFQTNVLALNAAVEAARAGEQGRGFAVVASEVRALAQRSASAAREVRTLIGASASQIEAGGELVQSAGETMNEIVEQVRQVSRLVAEITVSSSEQNAGISQVGEAVTALDENTQRNAALAEQSAAAAEHLQQQARRLAEAVSVFRLGGA
ncbi:methyl-accepting chemotaxis protein [Pseudorhodoferax sp.]|uniref:methyl-accepting chemotaxis protein n=1 Tax=Pseudorhodoferax sp. TaxID=1993553 RepID=UPI002DD6286B|nr:methyl-accepting chemotaxis protein [Pseudorhodoferax sp.]